MDVKACSRWFSPLWGAGLVLSIASAAVQAQSPLEQYQLVTIFPEPTPNAFPMGEFPEGDVKEVKTGIFVGTTSAGAVQASGPCSASSPLNGGQGCGTLYQLDTTTTPATLTLLWAFSGQPCGAFAGCVDGAVPMGTIAIDPVTKWVYGTTSWAVDNGCPATCGTIYRYNLSTHKMQTLYVMNSTESPGPEVAERGVFLASNGHLYGVTYSSDKVEGAIFEYSTPSTVPQGTPPNVYYVNNATIGGDPQTLMEYSDGNLYGVAQNGALFQFNPSAPADAVPCGLNGLNGGVGRLGVGADGNIYGVVPTNPPEVFSAVITDPTCKGTVFTKFAYGQSVFASPEAGFVSESFGRLFGTIRGNGGINYVYSFAPPPASTAFAVYPGDPNSSGSKAELTEGSDGWIYGTNYTTLDAQGGHPGSVFRFYVPPTTNSNVANQFGTLNVWDGATAIAVDARPTTLPSTDTTGPPGPRIYVAGNSNSNLATLFGGMGSGSFFLARFFQDGTLDKSFAATNAANNNGGFLQFGPVSGNPKSLIGNVAGIAIDKAGNIFVAGDATGTFFNSVCANPGGNYIWVAKFAADGFGATWCQAFGSGKDDIATELTLDSAGNAYVTGSTDGSLPGQTLQGVADAYIAKIPARTGTPITLSEFAWNGQNDTGANGISFCGGHLYVSLDAGTDGKPLDSAGWIAEFAAQTFGAGAIASQEINTTNPTQWGAGVVSTDAACNAYVAVSFFNTFGGIAQEELGLQKYDKALVAKKWEDDFSFQSISPGGILWPESITSVVIDGMGYVHAAGSTNFSMFGRPLPACALGELPLTSCGGWLATFNPNTGASYTRSAIEFGNVQTSLSQAAVDMYGAQHVAGATVGPMQVGGETEVTTPDAYETDFGPAALCGVTVPVKPCLRVATVTNLASPSCGTHVTPGSNVTFTATITKGGVAETAGTVTFINNNSSSPAAYPVLVAKGNPNGTVSYSTTLLPVGTNNVVAVFSGKVNSGGTTIVDNPSTNFAKCIITIP